MPRVDRIRALAAVVRSGKVSSRGFRRLLIGQTVSDLGSQLTLLAYPLLVLDTHGSAVTAGAVATAELLARFAFRLPGGALADAWNTRNLLVATIALRSAAVASVLVAVLADAVTVPHVIIAALIEGAGMVVSAPAESRATRTLVAQDELATAVAQGQAREFCALLVGPLIGGVLYSVGHAVPFAADLVSYAVMLVVVLRLPQLHGPRSVTGEPGRIRNALSGVSWVMRQPSLRNPLLSVALLNFAASGLQLTVLAGLRLAHESASLVGATLAGAGIGGVAGALATPYVASRLRSAPAVALVAAVWTALIPVTAVAPRAWVIAPVLVCIFLVAPLASTVIGGAVLTTAPEHLLGRVMAAVTLIAGALMPLGPIVAGALLPVGYRVTVFSLAAVCAVALLTCVPSLARRPAPRRAGSLTNKSQTPSSPASPGPPPRPRRRWAE